MRHSRCTWESDQKIDCVFGITLKHLENESQHIIISFEFHQTHILRFDRYFVRLCRESEFLFVECDNDSVADVFVNDHRLFIFNNVTKFSIRWKFIPLSTFLASCEILTPNTMINRTLFAFHSAVIHKSVILAFPHDGIKKWKTMSFQRISILRASCSWVWHIDNIFSINFSEINTKMYDRCGSYSTEICQTYHKTVLNLQGKVISSPLSPKFNTFVSERIMIRWTNICFIENYHTVMQFLYFWPITKRDINFI